GHASESQAPDHFPIDRAAHAVDSSTHRLGRRCIEKVGPDRSRGMNAEQQDQKRRHERPPADAGHPDKRANRKTPQRKQRIASAKYCLYPVVPFWIRNIGDARGPVTSGLAVLNQHGLSSKKDAAPVLACQKTITAIRPKGSTKA